MNKFQNPLVSVCVAVYNVEAWLQDCLDSIKRQTYQDWECLIVNDGSADNSPAIAQKFCDSDARFHLVNKRNGGSSTARNVGIESSRGEYIFFIDGDDMLPPDCLEYCIHAIGKADILSCGCTAITASGKVVRQANQKENRLLNQEKSLKEYLNRTILTSVWSKLYRREAIGDNRFDPALRGAQDLHFFANLLLQDRNLHLKVTNHSIYFYRILQSSVSHIKGEGRIKRLIVQIEKMDELYEKHRETITRCCLDEYARNMIRDMFLLCHLQGMIKRLEPWCMPYMAKYSGLIADKKSKEYKQSRFILTHSSRTASLAMTLWEMPGTLKNVIKAIIKS